MVRLVNLLSNKRPALTQTIRFNTNNPTFKKQLMAMRIKQPQEYEQAKELLKEAQRKLEQRTWPELYSQSTKSHKKKTGFNWEKIGKQTADGKQLYSLRLSRKSRLLGFREGNELVADSIYIHDHDATYR